MITIRTRDDWCALLAGADACVAPVLSLAEAPGHPHNLSRETFVKVGGRIQPAPPPRYSATMTDAPRPGAPAADGGDALIASLGFDPGALRRRVCSRDRDLSSTVSQLIVKNRGVSEIAVDNTLDALSIGDDPPVNSAPSEGAKPAAKPFKFGFLVHDVSRMRRTGFDAEMKSLGVTRSQWSVLAALSRRAADGVMQVDLARELDVGKVTIGGLIDRLEASGHVERRPDPGDRRVRRVYITERGYGTIHKMETIGTAFNQSTLEGISPGALQITIETLARVKENLRVRLDAEGIGLVKGKTAGKKD